MTSNVAPTILHRKTPTPLRSERKVHLPACDCLLLIPFPRSKARKHPKKPGISKLWLQSSKRRPIILDSNPDKTDQSTYYPWLYDSRFAGNKIFVVHFVSIAEPCSEPSGTFPQKTPKPCFFLRELLLNSGTISRTLSRTVQNLAPCPKLTEELPTSRWMRPQRDAHFGSFLRLLLFLSFSGKLFRNGCISCILIIDMFF